MPSQSTKSKGAASGRCGAASSLPAGLLIGNKHTWRVGGLLGSGACGSVHELHYEGNQNGNKSSPARSYVIKLAAMPPPSSAGATGGGKKRKKTAQERNADLIHHEHTLLANRLVSLRGKYIPNIPEYNERCAPPTSGILEEGSKAWRYLVMERMASPLSSLAPKIDGKSFRLNAVAQQMLTCLEQFHQLHYIFLDVKLDNFMVATTSTTSSQTVAKAVRLVDFGLVEHLFDGGTSKHRVDMFPNASLAGTPLYASLNVLHGHTPSRRDDLEALAYVIADLLLLSARRSDSSKTIPSTMLPWKNGTSDDDIRKRKEDSLSSGEFFTMFEHAEDGKVLKEFIQIVQALEYSKLPDYGQLHSLLGKLRGGPGKTSTSSKKSSVSSSSSKAKEKTEKARSSPSNDAVRDESPSKKRRTSARGASTPIVVIEDPNCVESRSSSRAARASRRAAQRGDTHGDSIDLTTTLSGTKQSHKTRGGSSSLRNKENASCSSNGDSDGGVKPMDWEPTASRQSSSEGEEEKIINDSDATEEAPPRRSGNASKNQMALQGNKSSNTAPSPKVEVRLRYVDGPRVNETFDLPTGYTTIIGREPSKSTSSRAKKCIYSVLLDSQLSKEHIKVEVNVTKHKTKTLKVTDLESTNGTFVNGKEISKGGWNNVFVGDRIQIGKHTFVVELA